MSGLLNILDGVASEEGRVVIMTTNHIESLDKAIIRPGRVDLKIELGLADKAMITELFSSTYQTSDAITDNMILDLAVDFAERIPELIFSPAEIMSFLKLHWRSPSNAVKEVQRWVSKSSEEKQGVKRADSWVVSV
jgi:chaperone BCS1